MHLLQFFFYWPGTNWCGHGHRQTESGEDPGLSTVFPELDACCRTHDKCPKTIPVGETVFGIKNKGSATISDCRCDDEFYYCLKKVRL